MTELNYTEVAERLGVSNRHVRRVLAANMDIVQPIIYSHKNRRFDASQVTRLKRKLHNEAIARGKQAAKKWYFSDRFGGPANYPDPKTMCLGQCEGTGWVPPKRGTNGEFTQCIVCGGTGKRGDK